MDLFEKCRAQVEDVKQVKAAGLYPFFHEITTRQHSEVVIDGHRTIMLGSNNYMGLTSDQRVIEAAKEALEQYGTGCSGSRFLNGTLSLHVELEKKLAEFTGFPDTMSFSTGFQTNLGILASICGRSDYIFFDRLNHASLVDAARLSFAKISKYNHNDMDDLEKRIIAAPEDCGKLIVSDGVFSMEGDLADLPNIVKIARKYGARIMIDDSHGLGAIGETGRGTGEYYGLMHEIDILMGTFSKSFASLGGFMASNEDVITHCRHVSRPFIFSASIPPANVAAVIKSIEIIEAEPERLDRLKKNTEYLREGYKKLGLPARDSGAPIIPIDTYTRERTLKIVKALLDNGVYVNAVFPPAVPEGQAIIRTSLTATMTEEQLDYALAAFDRVFNKLLPVTSEELEIARKSHEENQEIE